MNECFLFLPIAAGSSVADGQKGKSLYGTHAVFGQYVGSSRPKIDEPD